MSTQQFVIAMALSGFILGAPVPIAVIVLDSVIDYRRRLTDNFTITSLPHTTYVYIRHILPRRHKLRTTLRSVGICAIVGACVAATTALAFVGLVEVLG